MNTQIKEWAEKQGYHSDSYGENPKVALIGELHGTGFDKQKELIEAVKPKIVFHEGLQALVCNSQSVFLQKNRRLNSTDVFMKEDYSHPIMSLAKELDFTVVGCDASFGDLMFGKVSNMCSPSGCSFRERIMGQIITDCLKNSTQKYFVNPYSPNDSVIGIFGAEHLKKHSKLHKILKESNINYWCIFQ